jgi:hypothetical protein
MKTTRGVKAASDENQAKESIILTHILPGEEEQDDY